MNEIWVVKEQIASSEEGFTSDFDTVSFHRTEEGAKKKRDKIRKNSYIAALTLGGFSDLDNADPDEVVGEVESMDDDWAAALKDELAKPNATLATATKAVVVKFQIDVADIKIEKKTLED